MPSSVCAISLKSGCRVLAYNDSETDRHTLAISLSDDEGETWKWTKHLEDDRNGSFAYPCVIYGIQHPAFPIEVRMRFTAMNSMGMSQFTGDLVFTINEPGAWDVKIS